MKYKTLILPHLLFTLMTLLSNCAQPLEELAQDKYQEDAKDDAIGLIRKGYEAEENQFPWQVQLLTYKDRLLRDNFQQFCGGSIINATTILTAAHCTEGKEDIYVGAGTNLINNCIEGTCIKVSHIIEHENYHASSVVRSDVALLFLEEPLDLSGDTMKAISLLNAEQESLGYLNQGEVGTISGWGVSWKLNAIFFDITSKSDVLKAAEMKVASPEDIAGVFKNYLGRNYSKLRSDLIIHDNILPLVSTREENGGYACHGDSGGPFVINIDEEWYLAGLASFIFPSCQRRSLAGYTRITPYLDWIREQIQGHISHN